MIEFATLLIGLLAGERMVELSVQPPIASVHLVLDGETIAELDGPPWRARVDFGHELQPHRLTAHGFDENGNWIDSTDQILNYNRSSFESTIILDPHPDIQPKTGRIIWHGALNDPPLAIDLSFDGRRIATDDRGRFSIPPHDPDDIHVLEGVVLFDQQHSASAVLTFGGVYGDQLTSALTAIPLTSPTDQIWSSEQVRDWIVVQGRRPDVFKVTAGPGVLVVLRGDQLEAAIRGARTSGSRLHPKAPAHRLGYDVSAISPRPLKGHEGTFRVTDLGKVPQQGLRPLVLRRQPLVPVRGSDGRSLQKKGQRIWDALAVAGTRASASGRPRAVLLMMNSGKGDKSDLDSLESIQYLEKIHVPLFIWGRDPEAFDQIGTPGYSRHYQGSSELDRLCIDIAQELASQTIAWLQGQYIPQEVTLIEGAPSTVRFVQ
jgi:hypothetical protein